MIGIYEAIGLVAILAALGLAGYFAWVAAKKPDMK